jgi:hypothetical protein
MGVVVGKVGGREQILTGALKLCLHAPAPSPACKRPQHLGPQRACVQLVIAA